jgi:hypothetical protein
MSTTLTKSKTKEHTAAATGDCMFLLLAHHSQTYIRRRTDIRRKKKERKRKEEEEEECLTKWQQQQSDVRPFPINRPFLTMLLAKLSGQAARHMYRHLVIYDDTERTTRKLFSFFFFLLISYWLYR